VSSNQLEDSLDNLDRKSKQNYTVKVRMVKALVPGAPTQKNPIPDAMGGNKTSVMRQLDKKKPMPPPPGDELELLDDVAPPPLRPGKPSQSLKPSPEPAPVQSVFFADYSEINVGSSPSPQAPKLGMYDLLDDSGRLRSLPDEEKNDAAMMSGAAMMNGFASDDSLFGQMSVCSGCKEIVMMSDVSSGQAQYVNSKLYCKKCAASQIQEFGTEIHPM
jgi:hypothetical protein